VTEKKIRVQRDGVTALVDRFIVPAGVVARKNSISALI